MTLSSMVKKAKKLLLLDADDLLRAALKEQLEAEGEFEVADCKRSEDALRLARECRFDMALLDAVAASTSEGDTCRQLRKNGLHAPILMLIGGSTPNNSTDIAAGGCGSDEMVGGVGDAADSNADIGNGSAGGEGADGGTGDAGASGNATEDRDEVGSAIDDRIAKPFRFNALLARIRAHLHRCEQNAEGGGQRLGSHRFFPAAKLLQSADAAKIHLTEKETAILQHLLRARGQLVSNSELLQEIWGYGKEVTTATLETHIYRLRRKLEGIQGGTESDTGDKNNGQRGDDRQSILRTGIGGYRLITQDVARDFQD